MGNSLGTGMTTGWMEGKPWEIALGEFRWEGAIRERQQGGRKGSRIGNSLGRAPLGRSDTEATKGWTERKPWEIAWGELWWEGAIRE